MPKTKSTKPKKPYTGFPLTAHANGPWCKKIRGIVHYFGVWADPMSALQNYNRQAANLHVGRKPPPRTLDGTPALKDLGNSYLAFQEEKSGKQLITAPYLDACVSVVREFVRFTGKERTWQDIRPDDFNKYRMHLYGKYEIPTIERAITIVRSMFKHAYEAHLIDTPIRYGAKFDKPSLKEKRRARREREQSSGKRLFKPQEIRCLIDKASPQTKAMILLGINGGFGNTDCAELPQSAVDLEKSRIDHNRAKTEVERVVPLWPETVAALREPPVPPSRISLLVVEYQRDGEQAYDAAHPRA